MMTALRTALLTACLVCGSLSAASRPNIIVVLTDDHRYDAMGVAGHPFLETPNMDRLAKNGVYFKNAFVTTSLCSPSRASILTGLYAHNHGVVDNYNPVNPDLRFFPQSLQESGYETAFIGKWHMGDSDEKQRGFDHWVCFKGQGVYWPFDEGMKVKGRPVPQSDRTGFNVNGTRVPQKGYITDELTDYALEWLKGRTGEKPYFLYVSHKAVHSDFLPANRHAFRYEDKPVTLPASWVEEPERFKDVPMWVRNQRNSRHGAAFAYNTNIDLAGLYRRYCEALLAVDENLGRLLQAVEQRGELENTLIVYLGDNGFQFGEHGLIDKRCAYEESMRIPMLMQWPALVREPRVVTEMVANIDLAPTLLEAAGAAPLEGIDGQSFLPILKGESAAGRDAILYEYYWEQNYPQTPTMHAVREDRFKYIRYHGIWDVNELYDLEKDPKETTNLINDPAQADRIERMNRKLFTLLEESRGMQLPMVKDQGKRFHLRRKAGDRAVDFPDWFYIDPEEEARK